MRHLLPLLALLVLGACSTDDTPPPPGTDGPVGPVDPGPGSPTGCMAGDLLASLGKDRLLVGVSAPPTPDGDARAKAAPFSLRYAYLAGGIFPGETPCTSCNACNAGPWWGCWQDANQPPGDYVRGLVQDATAAGQLPQITYYEQLHTWGGGEGTAQVTQALRNVSLNRRLFNDWRFLLQQVGSARALLHYEPDLWGYAQFVDADPTKLPVEVATANPTDCGGQPNTLAGYGKCIVAMVRKYAPNAKVSLHANGWGTGIDVMINRDASLDLEAEARKTADFLLAAGGAESDFITVDATDRDAGYDQVRLSQDNWWDPSDAKLPHLGQALRWGKALSERMNKPHLWWQVPVGNMDQNNTTRHWKDNRVASFTARTQELARAHALGVAFGEGEEEQTTPETDGGYLYARVRALSEAGGQPPCP